MKTEMQRAKWSEKATFNQKIFADKSKLQL